MKKELARKFSIVKACPYCGFFDKSTQVKNVEVRSGEVEITTQCSRCGKYHSEVIKNYENPSPDRQIVKKFFLGLNDHNRKLSYPIPCAGCVERISLKDQFLKIKGEIKEVEEAFSNGEILHTLEELADVQIASATAQAMLGASLKARKAIMADANIKNYKRGYWSMEQED